MKAPTRLLAVTQDNDINETYSGRNIHGSLDKKVFQGEQSYWIKHYF